MVRIFCAAIAVLCMAAAAQADELQLPGIASDATAYVRLLEAKAPAGVTPKARDAATQAAQAARATGDDRAEVVALEQRVGLGRVNASLWLELAKAQSRLTPPDAGHAALAAWLAFSHADGALETETQALTVLAGALRSLGRDDQAAQTLEQVVTRRPDDPALQRLLADAQRAAGLSVRRVTVESEADPPRGCITFSVPPSRRADLDPQDWVRLEPPIAGAAVTREGDQFCVSGLPSGTTTKATIRAGLPAERHDSTAPLVMLKNANIAFEMPNRQPRVVFDTHRFILPTGQTPAVGLTTVNLSAVSLRLVRLSERNVAGFVRDTKLGEPVDPFTAQYQGEQNGSEIWRGRAAVPDWIENKPTHTALPLPDKLLAAGPGLYALIASAGDGTPNDGGGIAAVQIVLRTDLAPTVWRGADGLTIQLRAYSDAAVRPGARLRLLARNNDVLAETTSDAAGVGKVAAPLLRGEGPLAPALVEAFGPQDDYVVLDLNAASFDLSDRGVSGAADPGPLDAFVWTDRGIYRPGETVQMQALLRDNAGEPFDLPVQVTIRRPNGQVYSQSTPARGGGASLLVPIRLSAGASAGMWTIEPRADPQSAPIGSLQFRVDAFLPDRMAVAFGKLPTTLLVGQDMALPVTARFLYGAPGSGLSGHASVAFNVDPTPFTHLDRYRFGLEDEVFAPVFQDAALPVTDPDGVTSFAPSLSHVPDTSHPLKADLIASIDDPAGHASKAAASLPLRGTAPFIGIRPGFVGGEVDADHEAAFDIVAIGPDGAPRSMEARLRLVRERPDWRMVVNGRLARYETVYRDEPLETRDIALTEDAPSHFAKTLGFGRYRLEVAQTDGLAATSVRFRAGWAGADSADVPDRVDVSAATQSVPVGGTAHIHISAPFAGPATLLVISDRVQSLRTLDVPAGGLDVEVPVDPSWGPGAYVVVHVFRRVAGAAGRPARALGLVWVGVDPASRTLPVTMDGPDRLPPRMRSMIAVHASPGAWVSLAAVDEGILRLTNFLSPDPALHFLGRRRLGMDIRDDWGRLIAQADGASTLLQQGGDQGSFALPDVPIRTVTLFAAPVQAGPDGVASIPLDMPDFNGQVRLMAVAWDGIRTGAASRDVIVRDRLVAEPLLPRFLSPGDTTYLSVLLDNLGLPSGMARVKASVDGPLVLPQGDTLSADLAQGGRTLAGLKLAATGAGRGTVRIDVSAPDGFSVTHEVALTVRPARGPSSFVAGAEILAGGSRTLASPVPLEKFVPGTAQVWMTFGAPVRYDVAALAAALQTYPLSCLEQTTSQALALIFRADAQAGALAAAVSSILDRQRYDGGFALWSANGEAEPWLSAYALDVLLRARDSGVTVPEAALADGLKYLGSEVDRATDDPAGLADQAYRLYVLAKAGQGRPGAARVLAEGVDALPTPLARAQLGASLALAHDAMRARALFSAALQSPMRNWWPADYGTALRDQAATTLLLRETGAMPQMLADMTAALPGADQAAEALSTQEQAWLIAAAGTLRGASPPINIELDGHKFSGPSLSMKLEALAR